MLVEALGNFVGRVVDIARRPGPPLEAEAVFLRRLKAAFWAGVPPAEVIDPEAARATRASGRAELSRLLVHAFRAHILPCNLRINPEEIVASFRAQSDQTSGV